MKIEVYSPAVRRREMDAVLTALVEDSIGPGEQAKLLVQIAKERLGFDACLALRSPALALSIALKALGIEAGKGVLISYLSPRYYEWAIRDAGLVPLYCGTAPGSPLASKETVEQVLKERPGGIEARCVALHHSLGYLPESEAIASLGLPLIEDCSQSYGSVFSGQDDGDSAAGADGKPAPVQKRLFPGPFTSGVFTILGLEERDMLTSGGGALLYAGTRRDAALLRGYAEMPPEYALPDMNAAMAAAQFREGAKNLQKRKTIAETYLRAALQTRHKRFVTPEGFEYNNYAFPLVLESGLKDVKAYAKKKDIAVESAFENSIAASREDPPAWCREAYSLSLRTALFPVHPRLGAKDVEKVSRLITTLP
ncbi:MAG: DegT/DnrJ/EryC1/StrS family aminotransferase [Treponema sp.]|jgi:dTDP-4-amino-4,6-dideoxygalactose transaminase|nr:DegT/DnrJ/EryC1/StrS family aminotransferase [Treponema sp.]